MAKKLNALKLTYVSRGMAGVTNRRRAPDAAVYLMQLQSPGTRISALKRKLTVIIEAGAGEVQPVKIRHLA